MQAQTYPVSQTDHVMLFPEAARFLRRSVPWLRRRVSRGEITHSRFGRTILFERTELLRWIEAHRVPATGANR